jgi:zinc protease
MRTLLTLFAVAAIAFSQPAYKQLKYPKLGEVKIPEIETFTLPNGMKVFLLENHNLPLINGIALVRTGTLLEPADKTGVHVIAAGTMRTGGTKTKTGDQLDEQLEAIAAGVESSIDETLASVSFNCLKENTDEVLGVFHDVLTAPEFRQNKIDLLKMQYRSAISRRYDDAGEVNNAEFSDTVYGKDTPFGRSIEYETLDRIQREDLLAFHKRYYFPANVRLAIQGDFDKAAMRARLEQIFANWTVQQPPVPEFPKVTHVAKPGIYVGDKKEVNQTSFSIGHLGGLLSDKDYPALEVLSDILGGSFDSRLFRKVRTEMGLAYSVGAGWGAGYLNPGLFRVSGSTKSESTVLTFQTIQQEIEKIRTEPVTDQELNDAKEKVVNSFVFNFDRPSKTLSRLFRYEYYGYPKDFLFTYQKALAAVTKQDVLRVAKQYIQPEKFVYVAITNTDQLKTPLTELKLPITQLELKVKEPKKEVSATDPASLAKGKAMLARMQTAVGGAEKLAAIKDVVMANKAELGPMKVNQKVQLLLPDKVRQEQELPFGKVIAGFDGKSGFLVAPGAPGPQPMPPPVLKQVGDELFAMLVTLLRSDTIAGRTVNAIGENRIEISEAGGKSAKLEMDPATGLPAKLIVEAMGPAGKMEVERQYSDWRDVNGVKFAFKTVILQGGKPAGTTISETISTNTGVSIEEIMKK